MFLMIFPENIWYDIWAPGTLTILAMMLPEAALVGRIGTIWDGYSVSILTIIGPILFSEA